MKNKFTSFLLFSFLILSLENSGYAQEFNFDTESIEILENGNIIKAKNGFANYSEEQIKIKSDYFYLDKKTSILKTGKGTIYFLEPAILRSWKTMVPSKRPLEEQSNDPLEN